MPELVTPLQRWVSKRRGRLDRLDKVTTGTKRRGGARTGAAMDVFRVPSAGQSTPRRRDRLVITENGREADLSTKQAGAQAPPRLSRASGNRRWIEGAVAPPRQGPQALVGLVHGLKKHGCDRGRSKALLGQSAVSRTILRSRRHRTDDVWADPTHVATRDVEAPGRVPAHPGRSTARHAVPAGRRQAPDRRCWGR
jgi:hypothetical protein